MTYSFQNRQRGKNFDALNVASKKHKMITEANRKSSRDNVFEQSFSSGKAKFSHHKLSSYRTNDQLEREADLFSERMINLSWLTIKSQPKGSHYTPQVSDTQKPLPGKIQTQFESQFGYDFSNVRIQTGSAAARETKEANARAITSGNTIQFAPGEYQPDTLRGRKLLAHELSHVVQQDSVVEGRYSSNAPYGIPQNAEDDGLTVGPFEDLQSDRFSGVSELERAYDDETLIFNGRSGDFVAIIQTALQDFGFPLPDHGVDGIFGSETESKVLEFQKAAGATMLDGIVGPETMNLLDQWALDREKKEKKSFLQMARNMLTDETEICLLDLFERHVNGDSINGYYMGPQQMDHYITKNLGDSSLPEFTFPHPKHTKNGFIKLNKYYSNKSLEKFVYEIHGIKSLANSVWEGLERLWGLRQNKQYYQFHMRTIDLLINYILKRSKNTDDIYSCFTLEVEKSPWWKMPWIYYP